MTFLEHLTVASRLMISMVTERKSKFKQLLFLDNTTTSNHPVDLIYENNPNIDIDTFSLVEVNIVIKQMKLSKAPALANERSVVTTKLKEDSKTKQT